MNRTLILASFILLLPGLGTAQTQTYPNCTLSVESDPNFAYFETPPSNTDSWSLCIRADRCDILGTGSPFPAPQVVNTQGVLTVQADFQISPFAVCPGFFFRRVSFAPVTGPTITVRYFTRSRFNFDPTQPFIFRQELTAGVLSLAPAPSLNSWGVLGLAGLILIGAFAVRPR
jgi:hypothetical protein